MSRQRKQDDEEPKTSRRPASTVSGRENQLINLAVNLAEKQLREGTASAQVISHYLKMSSPTSQLEREHLEARNRLAQAQIEQLESQKRIEELYADALTSMKSYQGRRNET